MSRAKYLTAAAEHDLAVRAQAGDVSARDRCIEGIMPLIHREARKIANRSVIPISAEDLAQEAFLLIVKRFAKFDPERGLRLSTYFKLAACRIMRMASHENGMIRHKNRIPSKKPATLAAQLQHAGPVASLNTPNAHADGGCILDLLLSAGDDEDARDELAAAVRACVARIPDRRWRFIVIDSMAGNTLQKIGEPLGLTRERVRQILVKAMAQLEDVLRADPVIRDYVENRSHVEHTPFARPSSRRRKTA